MENLASTKDSNLKAPTSEAGEDGNEPQAKAHASKSTKRYRGIALHRIFGAGLTKCGGGCGRFCGGGGGGRRCRGC